jgi:hypothetical protein
MVAAALAAVVVEDFRFPMLTLPARQREGEPA